MEKKETIGQFLRNARNKKKLRLEDIIQQTKININVLKHLEDDELDELPSKTYVRGFVLSYAKAVSVSPQTAAELLDYTYETQRPTRSQTKEEKDTKADTAPLADYKTHSEAEEIKATLTSIISSLIHRRVVYSLISLMVVYTVGSGIYSFFSQLTQESKSIVQIKKTPSKIRPHHNKLFESENTKQLKTLAGLESKPLTTNKKKSDQISKEGKTLTNQQEKIETRTQELSEKDREDNKTTRITKNILQKEKSEKQNKELNLNGKFPFKEFYPTPSNMYDIVDDSPEAKDEELLPENIKASVLPNKQNVYIVAVNDSTWISYKVDDQKIKRYVLKKGRRLLIKGEQILLFMGNFNAAKVFLNNELITAQTRTGVKSMIFPENKAKNFELPLFPSFNGIPYSAAEYKANMATKNPTATN